MKDSGFREEADYLSKMFDGWLKMDFKDMSEKLAHNQKKGSPYMFSSGMGAAWRQESLPINCALHHRRREEGSAAIAGVAFDAEYLKDQFFPEMLDDVISRNVNDAQTDKNHAVMMLRGKYESAALAQSSGWDGGAAEVERNLEGAFPGLTLAIKLRGPPWRPSASASRASVF